MKLSYIIFFLVLSTVHARLWSGGQGYHGQGNGQGNTESSGSSGSGGVQDNGQTNGSGGGNGGQVGAAETPVSQALKKGEQGELLFMREEEKMARDVYKMMYKKWVEDIFANVAAAEQKHMDRMLTMIERYGLEDPVKNDDIGEFQNGALKRLFDDLTEEGRGSLKAALAVAARIEEIDISDLEEALDGTEDATLRVSYGRLMNASKNHLRAFVRKLGSRDGYKAQHLRQNEVDAILNN